ncbi:MAG TPA: protein kinase [Pyrinomonadaceae bacterium]|nr:protein kinase [Pyrinomonadaceae bacterium]
MKPIRFRITNSQRMSPDKSQLETITLDGSSKPSLNETTLPQQSLNGTTLDSRYSIEKQIGQGGVGVVYLARDQKLHHKPVVIKVLHEKSLQDSWVVQKFQQEKEALARVDHPGVVGILDTGELPDGKPYLVMQYIDGVTLRSQIKPEGMSLERAAEIIRQTGRALSAAHDRGIFHRDLKPENIMLQTFASGEEQVKIIDFGIAKLKDSVVAPSTMTGATAGTVAYMAPEQLSGRPVSAATDIFAMGAIAYELVTGRKPFNPETGFELLEMQRGGVRVKAKDLRPSLSEAASDLILRALSFDAQQRFASAREFGDALARALAEQTSEVPSQSAAAVPATQLATGANAPAQATGELSAKTIAGRYEPARVDTLSPSYAPPVEDNARRSGWVAKIIFGVAMILLIGAGAGIIAWKRDAIFGTSGAKATGAERSLSYSLTVQKMRDNKPYQDEFNSSGQEIFENGWKFRMNLTSPQDGYLYLLNEGPANGDAVTYNVLFPEAKTNNGSPRVAANQKLETAWMRFDDHQGTEKFWIVWSSSPLKELEMVTDAVNDRDIGEIKDAAKARSVSDYLKAHASPKPDVAKDSLKKETVVKAKTDVLVNSIELEHH